MLLRKRRPGLFHLNTLDERLPRPMASVVRPPLESLFCIPRLNAVYDEVTRPGRVEPQRFAQAVLDALDITASLPRRELDLIPREGPVVVVANHPFGGVEGLIMVAALLRVRPDAKVLANHLLGLIPEMRPLCVFVDVLADPRQTARARHNARGIKDAFAHLRRGGCLGVFPAGEVSSLQLAERRVADPAWNPHAAALARRTGAAVVPMHFAGGNSAVFHLAGLINPRLRTALLPREFLNKRHATARVRVGAPIPASQLARFGSDAARVQYLRRRTEALGAHTHRYDGDPPLKRIPAAALRKLPFARPRVERLAPVVAPVPASQLRRDIDTLPPEARLAHAGDLAVYAAGADRLPRVLREIGRLRELTFRAVGEGSGQPIDLDRFDALYTHLVLWDHAADRVAGAYRLGPTDRILPDHGPDGMYLATLFRLPPAFWRSLGPSVELGRSFVRQEYQRSFSPLLLLWKAIGAFLVRHPRYRYLLGPCSISQHYCPASRAAIATHLGRPARRHPLADLVTPRTPFDTRRAAPRGLLELARSLPDADELDDLVADIEPDGKRMPVLLRQYLKLGADILGFNVDPAFGHCVDALTLFDVTATASRAITRYMGPQGARTYLAHHGLTPDA